MIQEKKNYTLPILMMILLFGMISFVTGLQNPMGVIVKSQFGASNFMASLGYAANFIAYALWEFPLAFCYNESVIKRRLWQLLSSVL